VNFGLHHVALSTPNLERCVDFYCRVLGAEVATSESGWPIGTAHADRSLEVAGSSARFVHIKVGKAFIEIFEFLSPDPVQPNRRSIDFGIAHLCFEVENLEEEYSRMKACGMDFQSPPVNFGDGSRYVYGKDCDGNILEFLEAPLGCGTPSNYLGSSSAADFE